MSPSSALVDMTPHEVWSSKKPSVVHLKVFGHDAFVHVPKEKRRKLDKNAIKCIFIGYKEVIKGYKLWDPASRKTMYSIDVVSREVRSNSKPKEIVQTKNNLEMVRFELRKEEDDSDESIESKKEVKQYTLVVRRLERLIKPFERYSMPEFFSSFVLTYIDNDPKSVSEAVDSTKGKI
jgi:hypothetical protein